MKILSPRIIMYRDVRAATVTMLDVTLLTAAVGPNWLDSSLEQRILLTVKITIILTWISIVLFYCRLI